MHGLITEFKAFALKGNVVELAVAVVIGTAFGRITTSLVNNIIMPLFGVITGGIDFSDELVTVRGVEVTYGVFVQSIIEFLIIALVIFLALKSINSLRHKEEKKPEKEKVVEPSEEVKLLREIRDSLQPEKQS